MSVVKILAPDERLIDEIVSGLLASSPPTPHRNFSNDLVVFPGKRPAHVLRKALADRIGSSFIPPQIYAIDTFIEDLYVRKLQCKQQPLTMLDAVAILFDVHRRLSMRVGKESYRSLETFFPVGVKLLGELEELMMANLTERRIREVLQHVEYRKFHSIAEYVQQFYQDVERRGFVTRAMMYRVVAERMREIDWTAYRSITLAGFYAFTNVEKIIVGFLKEQENVTLLFQYGVGLKQQLVSVGIADERELSVSSAPEIHFVKAPDVHGQVSALAAYLQEQARGASALDQRTAVVLPSSEALFPVIHGALSFLPEDAYNIALQYPLSRTPVYGFLESLVECVTSHQNGQLTAPAYLKFLLHPYTKNIRLGTSAEATRVFVHALEDHILLRYAKALFTLEELENDEQLFASAAQRLGGLLQSTERSDTTPTREELRTHLIAIHDHTLRKMLQVRTVRELAERSMEVLAYIIEHSTANLHPYFHPYVQRLMEVLDGIRTSLLAAEGFENEVAAFQFLRKCLAAETIPFPGTPFRGLQVLGLLETRNLAFETLYVLDATDDILPGKPAQEMLLPQPIRAMLGLETSHDAERLIEYYFDVAVRSARRVVLLYSESDEREKSRFVQKLLWQKQQEKGSYSLRDLERQVRYRVCLETNRPEAIQKTKAMVEVLRKGFTVSAQALDTYLACPLKFYYGYLLRLSEREEVEDAIDELDVGKLVHRILARYFEPSVGRELLAADLTRDRLERVADACFEEMFGRALTGTALLLKRQVLNQLWRFITDYQRPMLERERVVLEGVEQWFEVEYRGYSFAGRIDRIERRGERIHILDYKTGADVSALNIKLDKLEVSDPETWSRALPSFQLPVYLLLYSRATDSDLSTLVPHYLFLGRKNIDEQIESDIGDDGQSPVEVLAAVEPVIFKVLEMIHDPDVSFTPTPELEKQCPRCPFTRLCGTQWVRGWKGME